MWIWLPDRAEGGDPAAIVARALQSGLSHIYVRTGSSRQGFNAGPFLDAVLPAAHAAGLRVYGWDFPELVDVGADVARAGQAMTYRTPTGHRIDGFVADIETQSEGTNLSAETAVGYSNGIRGVAGPSYPLIACVPRPSDRMIATYPYAAILGAYDAVAPMVYWLNRQPDSDVAAAVTWLAQFGKPVIPVGQAYDGAAEGGRPGPPTADEINRFLQAAEASGATGVSFWSWQHASPEIWQAIAGAGQFTIPADTPLNLAQIRAVQAELASLGYGPLTSGVWDAATASALQAFQMDIGAAPTGGLDPATVARLVGPLAPPIGVR
jgi:hypothetical protein